MNILIVSWPASSGSIAVLCSNRITSTHPSSFKFEIELQTPILLFKTDFDILHLGQTQQHLWVHSINIVQFSSWKEQERFFFLAMVHETWMKESFFLYSFILVVTSIYWHETLSDASKSASWAFHLVTMLASLVKNRFSQNFSKQISAVVATLHSSKYCYLPCKLCISINKYSITMSYF